MNMQDIQKAHQLLASNEAVDVSLFCLAGAIKARETHADLTRTMEHLTAEKSKLDVEVRELKAELRVAVSAPSNSWTGPCDNCKQLQLALQQVHAANDLLTRQKDKRIAKLESRIFALASGRDPNAYSSKGIGAASRVSEEDWRHMTANNRPLDQEMANGSTNETCTTPVECTGYGQEFPSSVFPKQDRIMGDKVAVVVTKPSFTPSYGYASAARVKSTNVSDINLAGELRASASSAGKQDVCITTSTTSPRITVHKQKTSAYRLSRDRLPDTPATALEDRSFHDAAASISPDFVADTPPFASALGSRYKTSNSKFRRVTNAFLLTPAKSDLNPESGLEHDLSVNETSRHGSPSLIKNVSACQQRLVPRKSLSDVKNTAQPAKIALGGITPTLRKSQSTPESSQVSNLTAGSPCLLSNDQPFLKLDEKTASARKRRRLVQPKLSHGFVTAHTSPSWKRAGAGMAGGERTRLSSSQALIRTRRESDVDNDVEVVFCEDNEQEDFFSNSDDVAVCSDGESNIDENSQSQSINRQSSTRDTRKRSFISDGNSTVRVRSTTTTLADISYDNPCNKRTGGANGAEKPATSRYRMPVRKQSERRRLEASDCEQCHKYFSDQCLDSAEKRDRLQACGRHRQIAHPPPVSDNYWEVDFPSTPDCIARGYMNKTLYRGSQDSSYGDAD